MRSYITTGTGRELMQGTCTCGFLHWTIHVNKTFHARNALLGLQEAIEESAREETRRQAEEEAAANVGKGKGRAGPSSLFRK